MKLGQSSQNIFWIKNGWQHQALDTDLTEFLFYCIPVEYQLGNSCQTRPRFYGYNQCWMMTCFLGQRDLDNVDMLFDPWISHNFPMGFQKSYSAISWYIMVYHGMWFFGTSYSIFWCILWYPNIPYPNIGTYSKQMAVLNSPHFLHWSFSNRLGASWHLTFEWLGGWGEPSSNKNKTYGFRSESDLEMVGVRYRC